MIFYTKQKKISNESRKVNKGCLHIYGLLWTFLMMLLLSGFTTMKAEAAGIKIYDYTTKKTSTYTGIQPIVTLNGKRIDKETYPGILVNGIALLSYYDTFYKSDIEADCVYDKAKGTVSISKYGTTIVMTIGSKKATVNGKSVTLPVAPMKIKYVSSGKVKVLVPSRYVSETLGLGYTWNSSTHTIAIEKYSIRLSYNNSEKFEYAGTKGKVKIDGKNVNLGGMPSIITNNTAMLRAKRVFADSSIGATYHYDKATGKITLTKNDIKLEMTIGVKTAYVNGKVKKLDTAPMVVKNYENNTSYVMVPGSFTATSLGYDYTWDKASKTSVITSKKTVSNPSSSAPELGDNGTYNDPGTVLYNWQATAAYGVSNDNHELNSETSASGRGLIYYVYRDYNSARSNSETFMVTASQPYQSVTSTSSGTQITVTAANMDCIEAVYQMAGTYSNYVNTISTANMADGTGTKIVLDLLSNDYRYDLSFSQDKTILFITVYKNCLTSAVIGVNKEGDYLTLSGIDPLKVNISPQSGSLNITIPDTADGLGAITSDIIGTSCIKQFSTQSTSGEIQIVLGIEKGYDYYIMENGNQYTLSFRPAQVDTEPETPVVIDKSKYEITIPIPSGITRSMISDEDFYHSNYFVIRLQGDYTDFYKEHSINHSSNTVKKISVSLNKSGNTEIKVATTKLQGYEYASDSEAIYVHIGNPRDIYKNIVVLDPGHGGPANGAYYSGVLEKDLNLKILYTIGKKYFNSDPSKLKVYYTRTTDVDMSLSDRAAFAKKVGADLFVSLHMNAVENAPGVRGSEVFYSTNNNKSNSAGLNSQKLAEMLNTNIYTTLGTKDRGVKKENYTVIYKNTVPAVLIELGFMTNADDFALLTDKTFQDKAAKTIYNTLLQVFEKYPTGR